MALVDFDEELEQANSVLDLARRLGERCMADSAALRRMMRDPQTSSELKRIEVLVGAASLGTWEKVIERPASLGRRLGAQLGEALARAKIRQPLDLLGVLHGLCAGALMELFATTGPRVELVKGMPVPFASPPLPESLEGKLTTSQDTLSDGELLFPLPFDLYAHIPEEELRVVLDFGHAERLDALTWDEEEKLPLIATLHPEGGGEYEIRELDPDEGRFFGVRPKRWDGGAIGALLEQAKAEGARIAVLPELSLPSPAALERLLARNHGAYPPIVVAGSAHQKHAGKGSNDEIRANESRIYLDGRCVAVARKHHRYKTKRIGDQRFQKHLRENLTAEQKTITVLAGRRTHIGVAICADLLEKRIPRLLVDAGVNLLLAPTMTPEIGSFNTALTQVAGLCQGVAVAANTRWADDGKPFLCMCAVPRPDPKGQSQAFVGDGANPAPKLAVLDPNRLLPDAVTWPERNRGERA